ncbi:MAG TPA: UvrD-helicase domain-containing protein [Acidimicrobiales bacterium]|nr:UvrD-helicase domain-containing protein [Acidimicrobiales bacterium]
MTSDLAGRRRIREELGTTMLVVAGAGTGKTTEMVGRIVALVSTGAAQLREIAAITFTEAAASELRERVRSALAAASSRSPDDGLLRAALEEVDEAAISTLHAFAERLLLEQAAAVEVPSGFCVMDDSDLALDFETRWARFADALFDDPAAQPALVRGFSCGLRHAQLRELARALHDDWDRLEESEGGEDPGPPSSAERSTMRPPVQWPEVDVEPVVHQLRRALSVASECSHPDDNLLGHLRLAVTDALEQLLAAGDDEESLLQLLANLPSLRCAQGRQEHWAGRIEEVRDACSQAEAGRIEILDTMRRAVLSELLPRLADFASRCASERASEGRLAFGDLLVHARRILRQGGEPTRALRRRYRWVFVDELQDADPVQVELAALLASEHEGGDALSSARPGAIFAVGDPGQSIYRFRRADIGLWRQVADEIGEPVVLDSNFRSVPGIIAMLNFVFGHLFGSQPSPGQAEHHPLRAERDALAHPAEAGSFQLSFDHPAPGHGELPPEDLPKPVVVLGDRLEATVAEVRRRAARDAAHCIRLMVEERWRVAGASDEAPRPVCFSDVALLMPARTSLPSIEEALDKEGVPYRLEGSSLLWGTEDVRDVLCVLRAADDPADELALLAALRSPGLGCGDDDLLSWAAAGGTWDVSAEAPEGFGAHPVARAMAVVDCLRRERFWREPSQLVLCAMDSLRSFQLAYAYRRPTEHWQRLRWLCDQARRFDESSAGSLRSFLEWARRKGHELERAGGVGTEDGDEDDDAVRVMTVHHAKGLEFPVVVLAGLERAEPDGRRSPPVLWSEDGTLEAKAGSFIRTAGYDEAESREQELHDLERSRLLYVAMTRARDHLVLCLHHRPRDGEGDSSLASRIFDISRRRPDLWRKLGAAEGAPGTSGEREHRDRSNGAARPAAPDPEGLAADAREWLSFCDTWAEERAALLRGLARRPVLEG